jgi:hypothetical protein
MSRANCVGTKRCSMFFAMPLASSDPHCRVRREFLRRMKARLGQAGIEPAKTSATRYAQRFSLGLRAWMLRLSRPESQQSKRAHGKRAPTF